jgi:hypothetical protein
MFFLEVCGNKHMRCFYQYYVDKQHQTPCELYTVTFPCIVFPLLCKCHILNFLCSSCQHTVPKCKKNNSKCSIVLQSPSRSLLIVLCVDNRISGLYLSKKMSSKTHYIQK